MDLNLSGQSALITGSTLGIGLAIAQALRADGADVIINGRSATRLAQAVDRLKRAPGTGSVRGLALDLSTPQGAASLLAELPSVDILVNNLGIFEPKPFVDIPDEDWAATVAASFSSPASPAFRSPPRWCTTA